MKVVSTRGKSQPISFEKSLFTSYCDDGGMTMPETIPKSLNSFYLHKVSL